MKYIKKNGIRIGLSCMQNEKLAITLGIVEDFTTETTTTTTTTKTTR